MPRTARLLLMRWIYSIRASLMGFAWLQVIAGRQIWVISATTLTSYNLISIPDFTITRNFWSGLVKAKTDLFVIEERPIEGTAQKTLYLRAK